MKKALLFSCLIAALYSAKAQYITLSVDTVDLGVVYEDEADSALVYLKNMSPNWSFFIAGYHKAFPFYGDTVVDIHYTSKIVYQGDSLAVWVIAKPEHNVVHKGSILVFDAGMGGEVIIPYKFQGRYRNTYYSTTENLTEGPLRSALNTRLGQGFVSLSYNAARDEMYADLDNVGGDVTCVYTGRVATFNTRAGATSNNFNCEHTFPQGFFNENLPMKSDIHHLFSTDITANSERGNLPFGVVSNPSWQVGGSKKNSSTFEPRDAQKGSTARAMMYFVLRYQDYSNHFAGQEAILRQWHHQYPPSVQDSLRNEGIYQLQNNRNPFTDYPQFAERITNLVGATSAPPQPALYVVDTVEVQFDSLISSTRPYRLYVVNYGNTAVPVSGFQFSNGAVQFAAGSGNSTVLQPRQALEVSFNYPPGINLTGETLTFTAILGNATQQTVYFKAYPGPIFGIEEAARAPKITVYPDRATWLQEQGINAVNLLDMAGRMLESAAGTQGELYFDASLNGIYILQTTTPSGSFSQKIVINR